MKEFIKGFLIVFVADWISLYIVYHTTIEQAVLHTVIAGIFGGALNYLLSKKGWGL